MENHESEKTEWIEPALMVVGALTFFCITLAMVPMGNRIRMWTDMVAAAVFLYGLAKLVWVLARRFGLGLVVMVVAVLGLITCWSANSMIGVMACGFLAVIGAVMMMGRRLHGTTTIAAPPPQPPGIPLTCPACGEVGYVQGADRETEIECPVCQRKFRAAAAIV